MTLKGQTGNAAGSTRERIELELSELIGDGKKLLKLPIDAKAGDILEFTTIYQHWYTRALAAVRSLLPDRLDEFRRQYERDPRRKSVDAVSYTIQDFTQGVQASTFFSTSGREPRFDINSVCYVKLNSQVEIVSSAFSRLDSLLADLRGILQADLFDSEVEAARHLAKNGHLRAGGAVAGVVLEAHLGEVCTSHSVVIKKRDPHISDYNDALKQASVFDVPQWRWLQRLADIRNLCDHKKQRDPTLDEVNELIDAVDRALKTLR